jgi:hypothetical protein
LSGGIISGNTAYKGGGVCNYGTFMMSGGMIFGNKASIFSNKDAVAGVYHAAGGTFNWCGGVILSDAYIIGGVLCIVFMSMVIWFLFLFFKKRGIPKKM